MESYERIGAHMDTIGSILQKKTIEPPRKGMIQHEWQAFAYKVWKEYDGDPGTLKNVMRFFKTWNMSSRSLLDHAYSFCKDYTGKIPKIKMFYWKFWQLKKNKPLTRF